MVSNKRLIVMCLIQYLLILGYHLIYSLIYCTMDQTIRVAVWSVCVLAVLVFFAKVFQKQIDLVVYVTMFSVLITVTYVGFLLHILAFSVMVFFGAGIILGSFIRRRYCIIWTIFSSITVIVYTLVWPDIIREMVGNMFLYYGYVIIYLVGSIWNLLLVSAAEKYFNEILYRERAIKNENDIKNRFWANVSDEIRAPINVINGMSQLLKTENINSRAKEYTSQIENASTMMQSIVNNTMQLTQIETGMLKPKEINYDIYRVAHGTILVSSANIKSNNVSMVYCINPKVPSALIGDPEMLSAVIGKLLDTATIFTDTGKIELDIDAMSFQNNNSEVNLSIKVLFNSDKADEKVMNSLFNGFESFGTNRTAEEESVGLRLQICRMIVEMLNGKIEFQKVPGTGMAFEMEIKQVIGIESEIISSDLNL